MPTCPNCGTIVLEGEPYCSHCGATFVWNDNEEDDFESQGGRQHREYLTPYDIDFFNELYNSTELSVAKINEMYDGVIDIQNRFSCKLGDIELIGEILLFKFPIENEYYDLTLRATCNINTSYGFNFFEDIQLGDFSKLYKNQDFRKIVREKEAELELPFKGCRARILGNEIYVSATFGEGYYLNVNLEKMCFEI